MTRYVYVKSKKDLDFVFFKFILFGALYTFMNMLTMLFFYDYLKLGYWISSFVSLFLISIIGYKINKKIVFKNYKYDHYMFLRFIACVMLCYFFS